MFNSSLIRNIIRLSGKAIICWCAVILTTYGIILSLLNLEDLAYARSLEVGIATFDSSGKLPTNETIESFEKKLGRPINTINWFLGFNADRNEFPEFPSKRCQQLPAHIIPMLTLEPWADATDKSGNLTDPFKKINEGKVDSYLTSFAKAIKKSGRAIRLRFGHEMIQSDNPRTSAHRWYPWQDCPMSYVLAYQRVYRIFKKELGNQIQFVWAPNFEPYYLDVLKKYYPGSQYVDWIGIDGYNWAGGDFDSIFKKIYLNLVSHSEIFGNKPIMLSEIGAARQPQTNNFDKAIWIKDAFIKINTEYPHIAAFYWFNINKERDWRLDETSDSWEAFKNGILTLR